MRAIALAIILVGCELSRAVRNREITDKEARVEVPLAMLFLVFLIFGM
jgi:hypothetical protein